MQKGIKNANKIARKPELALTRVGNDRFKVASKKKQKREGIVARQKTKAMVAKCQRARGGSSLSSKEEKNYKNNIEDRTNPDQANDKYL